jgi:dienelactone hydrolase
MHRRFIILLAFATTAALAQFSYNAPPKLGPKLVDRQVMRNGALVQDITYASPKGGLVPAFLVTQPNASSAPAVIFMHWGLGDRHTFLDDAIRLASYGVNSLLIDAPFVRPNSPKDENADLVQAVVDVRRGIDLLVARKDVDPKRIGFVGLSYGAHVGAMLASAEPRLRALVLAGGLASNSELEKNPALATYDAEKWINKPHAAPVFLQFARNDEYVTHDQAARFIKATSEPSLYKWYEGNHNFNAAARNDRDAWLSTELGFTIPDSSYRPIVAAPGVPAELEIGKLGVVAEMPGMQNVVVKRDITFKYGQRMDVYYPFGMTGTDRIPAIIAINGQSTDAAFMASMRQMRFATTFAEALAVRSGRIVVVPDIRKEGDGDPANDLRDLTKYLTLHAADLQIDATQMGIVSRSAGYSYALRSISPIIKVFALWYGNLGDPAVQSLLNKDTPMLVVTAEHDFWYDAAATQKFIDATGAQHIHLPDGDHAFEVIDDLDQSRDAFVKTATFLRDHLPVQ